MEIKPPISVRISSSHVQTTDLFESLEIKKSDLEGQMKEQPKEYFFWCSCYAEMKRRVRLLKAMIEERESEIAQEQQAEGLKRKMDIKYAYPLDKKWKLLTAQLRANEYSQDVAQGAVHALEQRHEQLQSLNANSRRERYDS